MTIEKYFSKLQAMASSPTPIIKATKISKK